MQDTDNVQALKQALEQEQQARHQAEADLNAAEEARQEFVSLVTHELRVPMTSIRGYTDLLLKGIMGPVNEAQTNFLNVIRTNVERMSRMVADLSAINKIEGERLKLTLTEVELMPAVEEVLQPHKDAMEEKELTLKQDIPENLPQLTCDRQRLIQILSNVLSNAIQYTPQGGTINIRAKPAPDNDKYVHISVQDNGIGILEHEQAQIFEKFFRASDEETRQTPGNGLALHLSKLLAELQNGRLWFESTRGTGSIFYLSLPISTGSTTPSTLV